MPPSPPDRNCEVGLIFLGSLCPSRRANARFEAYGSCQLQFTEREGENKNKKVIMGLKEYMGMTYFVGAKLDG
jgi:hypothetical protein